ncbi:MAG: N-acetylneuraminate lyase [Ruminococcaceae bacterium]|nr:N-acetylneuraminate lyase [Oscillospiraceae bacterium]
MNNKLFTGILPAIITPFHDDGTFNRRAAEEVIDYEYRFPIKGFYINGATGEGPIISEKTRMEMAETAVEKSKGRGKIINHIGAPDSNSAFRLAKHAAEIGCDAISSVLPNFYFKYTSAQILDYYKRIADISGLPVVVYANGLMNQNPVDFMEEVMKIDGVIGVKYTIFNYYDMHRICELNGGNINVLNGPDEMLICGLTMGADGGIGTTYNIMPGWYCELYDAFRAGKFEKAREIQFRINHVIDIIRRYPTSIPFVKEVFRLRGIDAGHSAYPARVYTAEESAAMRWELVEAGVPDV